jgi:hypothetical protein
MMGSYHGAGAIPYQRGSLMMSGGLKPPVRGVLNAPPGERNRRWPGWAYSWAKPGPKTHKDGGDI